MAIYIGESTDPNLVRRAKRSAPNATLKILGVDLSTNGLKGQVQTPERKPYMAGDLVVGWQGEGGPFVGEQQTVKAALMPSTRPRVLPEADLRAIPPMPPVPGFTLDLQTAPMSRPRSAPYSRRTFPGGGQPSGGQPSGGQPNMTMRPAKSVPPAAAPELPMRTRPGWALDPGLAVTTGGEAAGIGAVWAYDQVKKRQALDILTKGNAGNFKANLNMAGTSQLERRALGNIPRIESRRYAAQLLQKGRYSASQANVVLNNKGGAAKARLSAAARTSKAALKIAGRAAGVAGVGISVYDELKALPKDASWARRGVAAATGAAKEMDNLVIGGIGALAAGALIANPIGAAAFGLTLATVYGFGFDKYANRKISRISQQLFHNF